MAAESFVTLAEYRLDAQDDKTPDELVEAMLSQQSAKLRAKLGRAASRVSKSEDAKALARYLVVDSSKKRLVRPTFEGVGEVEGATQASFTAGGFQSSYTLQNPSGAAYFDLDTLATLKQLLGCGQQLGTIMPRGLR